MIVSRADAAAVSRAWRSLPEKVGLAGPLPKMPAKKPKSPFSSMAEMKLVISGRSVTACAVASTGLRGEA